MLRPFALDDFDAVHDWTSRLEACRYQAWGPNTPEQTRAFLAAAVAAPPSWRPFAIELDGRVVGSAQLSLDGPHVAEIGFTIHPDLWGRGLATLAGRELLRIAFRELGVHRVFATCDPRNAASGRVLAKLGLAYEGRMREALLIRDGWRDSDLYAILESEYEPGR
jgi:[ribosomal protein S5]-alanine N-acetyltransferase